MACSSPGRSAATRGARVDGLWLRERLGCTNPPASKCIGQGVDLHDIARVDWPSVRKEIEGNLYSELEPLPVPRPSQTRTRRHDMGHVQFIHIWTPDNAGAFHRRVRDTNSASQAAIFCNDRQNVLKLFATTFRSPPRPAAAPRPR